MSDNITIQSNIQALVYKTETGYTIRSTDWNRIKDDIKELEPSKDNVNIEWSSVCFGISGSGVIAIIGYYCTESTPKWVLALTAAIIIFCIIIGMILRSNKKDKNDICIKDVKKILKHFNTIEGNLYNPKESDSKDSDSMEITINNSNKTPQHKINNNNNNKKSNKKKNRNKKRK